MSSVSKVSNVSNVSNISKELENSIVDYQTFDFDHLIYNKPRKEHGRYIGKIKYKVIGKKTHQRIIIKTPRLKCIDDIKITEDRCSIELQLFNNNVDFYQFLIKFDDKNIMTAFRNRNEWFGKDFPLDIIDEFYKPILKMNSNKCPTLKVKILYDELKNFDLELLKKDTDHIFYLECVGLRFLTQQFTMVWKLNYFTTPPPDVEIDGDYYESGLIDRDEALSDVLSTESSDDYVETTPSIVKEDSTSPVVLQEVAVPVVVATENTAVVKQDPTKVIVKEDPMTEVVKEDPAEVVIVKEDKLAEVVKEDKLAEVVKEDMTEVVKEDMAEVVKEDMTEVVGVDIMGKVEKEIDKLEARLAKVEESGGKKMVVNKKRVIKCANNRRRIWL